MGLHQRRKLQRPGFPEAAALFLIVLTALPALLWVQENVRPSKTATVGRVTQCDITLTHYNATDLRQKVSLDYAYDVGGTTYHGHFEGLWPQAHSPNALIGDDVNRLRNAGFPLQVFYDPRNPRYASIHEAVEVTRTQYARISLAALAVTLLYCVYVYPNWKERS